MRTADTEAAVALRSVGRWLEGRAAADSRACSRAVAAFVDWRLRQWAAAIEARDRCALERALRTIDLTPATEYPDAIAAYVKAHAIVLGVVSRLAAADGTTRPALAASPC